MKLYKKYIDVVVHVNTLGEIMPLFIVFETQKYKIEKILLIKKSSSAVGGSGILYQCEIQNSVRNIYLERNRWFIESLYA